MDTKVNNITTSSDLDDARANFIELLSQQFIAITGCGVYVYLNPVTINGLYSQYLSVEMPMKTFARKCVKDVLE